jgi:hypothetical protein
VKTRSIFSDWKSRLYGTTGCELACRLRSFKVMANKRAQYVALLQ